MIDSGGDRRMIAFMNKTMIFAALALSAVTSPVFAETIIVAPGDGAQSRLQEALIVAQPGDVVMLGAGRYALTDGLSLDVDRVTLRGAGQDASILDFSGQLGAGEGLLVTSDDVTLRDFAVENSKGDGIKSKGADNIVYARLRVEWTGGPKETNGAYGVYPVESVGVLIDGVTVRGASDAGIYVGQSKQIVVRNSVAMFNVAGIEIENSRDARVTGNYVSRNTGGILVFDLPNLPNLVNEGARGGMVRVDHNIVARNDTPNFAPKGNIVASVRRGTGIMVMANDTVEISDNIITSNDTAGVLVIAYPLPFEDGQYDPFPHGVSVTDDNSLRHNGSNPQYEGGAQMTAMFGGALPPVVWDGLGHAPLGVGANISVLSLGLPEQGAGVDLARPSLAGDLPDPFGRGECIRVQFRVAQPDAWHSNWACSDFAASPNMEARARP